MATEKVKVLVKHPKRYMAVDGKLQKVPVGTEVSVDEKQAEKLKHQLGDPSEKTAVVEGELVKGDAAAEETIAELTKRAEEAEARATAAEEALIATTKAKPAAKK